MDDVVIARAIHVLAILVWIGGVAMVTTAIIALAAARPHVFGAAEARFSGQAHIAILLAGANGFYMIERLGLSGTGSGSSNSGGCTPWWLLFALLLFVAEPLFLHRWFGTRLAQDANAARALAWRLQCVMLAISLVAIFGAVAGSHGMWLD